MAAKTPRTKRQREAVALHEAGRSAGEIAKIMGVTDARARQILTRLGITPHRAPVRWPHRLPRQRRTLERHNVERHAVVVARQARIVEWLRADPALVSVEIARRCGVSVSTVLADRRAVGLPAPSTRA